MRLLSVPWTCSEAASQKVTTRRFLQTWCDQTLHSFGDVSRRKQVLRTGSATSSKSRLASAVRFAGTTKLQCEGNGTQHSPVTGGQSVQTACLYEDMAIRKQVFNGPFQMLRLEAPDDGTRATTVSLEISRSVPTCSSAGQRQGLFHEALLQFSG